MGGAIHGQETSSGIFCVGLAAVEREEAIHSRDLKGLMDTLIHADEGEAAAILLATDVGANQSANAG